MTTVSRTLRFAASLLALSLLLPPMNAMGDAPAPATGPGPGMIKELPAAGPHPSLGNAAEVLGRLVGDWDVAYGFVAKDGTVSHGSGEYLAAWVMDGRAVQVLWSVDPRGGRQDREIYTMLHYVDPKSGIEYASFIDPEHSSVARFSGAAAGSDRIVILTHDYGGKDNRWSFNDIRPGSFVFRDEQSSDGGKTWRLLEEDHMTRRTAAAAAF